VTVNASTAQLSNGGKNREAFGLGVAYTTGGMTLAVGYGSNSIEATDDDTPYEGATGSITDITAAVTYAMGATTLKAIYQDKSADVSYEGEDYNLGSAVSMGVSVDHKIDTVSVTAYTISTNITSDLGELDETINRMGLGVAYDLGGGATVKAGWAQIGNGDDAKSITDVGVNFSF
jgi:outer membrane protein OmpU